MARKVITITLPDEMVTSIDNLADSQGLSRSKMIERGLMEYIDSEKTMMAAFANPVIRDAMVKAFGNRDVLKAMAGAVGEEVGDDQ